MTAEGFADFDEIHPWNILAAPLLVKIERFLARSVSFEVALFQARRAEISYAGGVSHRFAVVHN